jgi:hypothetical protein
VAIPAEYVVVREDPHSRGVLVKGTMDGTKFDGPRQLEAGDHELRCEPIAGRVALFWARAWEKGFSPFPDPNNPIETREAAKKAKEESKKP